MKYLHYVQVEEVDEGIGFIRGYDRLSLSRGRKKKRKLHHLRELSLVSQKKEKLTCKKESFLSVLYCRSCKKYEPFPCPHPALVNELEDKFG